MKRLAFAGVCAALVLGFVLAAFAYRSWRAAHLGFMAQENAATFVRPHSPRLGPEDARVFIVEFTDPACETCAAFSPIIQQLMDGAPGRIQLVVRYAPLHTGSGTVVRILEAAKLQGRFWQTLHLLYEHQDEWTKNHRVEIDAVWQLLPRAGLDVERVRADMDDPRVTAAVTQDMADGRALGVRKTPGIFVNGKPLEPFGAQRLADLVQAELRDRYGD